MCVCVCLCAHTQLIVCTGLHHECLSCLSCVMLPREVDKTFTTAALC